MVGVACCDVLMLLNKLGFGVSALDSGTLIPPNGLLGAFSCATTAGCCPKLKAVEDADADDELAVLLRPANGLLAALDEGVAAFEVPNMFVDGAAEVVLSDFCTFAPKLKRPNEGAVPVEPGLLCPLVIVLKSPVFVASDAVSFFGVSAPNPPKMLVVVGAAVACDEAPNPLNMPVVAGVLTAFCGVDVGAPKVNGAGAGAVVLEAFGAADVVPNIFVDGALPTVPNSPPELVALVVLP